MKSTNIVIVASIVLVLLACKKTDFLAQKPSTGIIQPTTLTDFQLLLENFEINNIAGPLAQISSDDFEVPYSAYMGATETERNAYIWAKEFYGSDVAVSSWNAPYQQVFYANVVLEGLERSDSSATISAQKLKGWALFNRAWAFYDLTRNFCKPFDRATAGSDMGIPLKLSSRIDQLEQRSTLQQTFEQILKDLNACLLLLPWDRQVNNLNRPSKVAAYALLARIFLDRREYADAEKYADLALDLYSTLIDYNTVSQTSATPFSLTHNELIYNNSLYNQYIFASASSTQQTRISPSLLSLYASSDLRLKIFYGQTADGGRYKKRGYNGSGFTGFSGLATDELYLIKAECLARRRLTDSAMEKLNQLLVMRMDKATVFVPLTAASPEGALNLVLLERRKELVWRGLRWHDLKRLNKEGMNLTLTRTLNNQMYTLPANDPRYIFPIPNDEMIMSGIIQNDR